MANSFENIKVYYSRSISGTPESDSELPWKIVQYIIQLGADVLSKHVAARNLQEMEEIRAKRAGDRVSEFHNHIEPWFGVRKIDCEWVDEATHLIALVKNGPMALIWK